LPEGSNTITPSLKASRSALARGEKTDGNGVEEFGPVMVRDTPLG
jgi:hypothetical protein